MPSVDTVTVLYRRDEASAPDRLDPIVQAAGLALEAALLQRGLAVRQPSLADAAALQAPQVLVTFGAGAGLTLVFALHRVVRALPDAAAVADVRLVARLFNGARILMVGAGRGQMHLRVDVASRSFAERHGLELAAERAARDLVEQVVAALRSQPAAPFRLPRATAGSPTVDVPTLVAPARRWALVAGVSDYAAVRRRQGLRADELCDLPGVRVDVRHVTATLGDLGFAAPQVQTLLDAQATGLALRAALKGLAAQVGPDDLVMLFISAHGAGKSFSPSGYGRPILADDGGPQDPASLDFWELQSLTRNLPARNVVWVVDTCYAGNAARNLLSAEVSGAGVALMPAAAGLDAQAVAGVQDDDRNFAVLTAAAGQEVSLDLGSRGGLFTVHLLDALRKSSGTVPLLELYRQHVREPVVEYSRRSCQRRGPACSSPQQTPQLAYAGRGDLIRI